MAEVGSPDHVRNPTPHQFPPGWMIWRTTDRALEWLVPTAFGVVLCLVVPLRTGLQFGGDEGYELMKAFLISLGHPLYSEIWNDQPPLHTELLALLFTLFGPTAYVARLLSVGFAVMFVAVLYRLVRRESGRTTGLVAVGLLVSSAFFLQLSVSVMLELPAMAVALAAVLGWRKYFSGEGKCWLMLSGVLFGCALQVKLTAGIFAPALIVDYFVRQTSWYSKEKGLLVNGLWKSPHDAIVWSMATLLSFGVTVVIFYSPAAFVALRASHFSEITRQALASEGRALQWSLSLGELALLVPASAGIAVAAFRRRWALVLPVALLLTVFVIHAWHRPYWYYYELHFAVPLAWLAAVGIVETSRMLWALPSGTSLKGKLRFGSVCIGWSMIVSLVLVVAPKRAWNELMCLSAAAPAPGDLFVIKLSNHAAQTRWVFTDRAVYAFWARLPVPPELAVIPRKRFWSGSITETEVLKCLERYRPEQILLVTSWATYHSLSAYIQEHYQPDPNGGTPGWFWRKSSKL